MLLFRFIRLFHSISTSIKARGREKVVSILLKKSSALSLSQAAIVSARCGHLEVVRLLLECAEDSDVCNSALVQAASRGHTEIVVELVQQRHHSPEKEAIKRAILSSASKNYIAIVQALIPISDYDDRKAALVASCANDQLAVASLLIADLPGRMMDYSLQVCATKGHADLVRDILVGRDADQIPLDAVLHSRSVARAKGFWQIVESTSEFLSKHYPHEQFDSPEAVAVNFRADTLDAGVQSGDAETPDAASTVHRVC